MELLFGFMDGPLDLLATEIERCLGVRLDLHDSLWRGGDYYRFESDSETLFLQTNNDGGPPEEPAEENFAEFPFLLYVETKSSPQEVAQRLQPCCREGKLLRPST